MVFVWDLIMCCLFTTLFNVECDGWFLVSFFFKLGLGCVMDICAEI